MAINKAMRKVLKALSYGEIDVKSSRIFANLKAADPMSPFYKTLDYKFYNGDHEIPTRIYFPEDEAQEDLPVLLFLHGGGWVTESVDNYNRVCARMAKATGHIVVSVEYRLAPEFRFPVGLLDCYAVAQAIFTRRFILNTDPGRITIIGDSAGGNLAAALSLMARDRKEFMPHRQILIYPALSSDYTESSPYPSVQENGTDFLLTALKMQNYIELYQSSPADLNNPYFSPLAARDLTGQPRTLILTAEYDPLRDEGEDYGRRLEEAGNKVEVYRLSDALHGFFALGIKYYHVQESFEIINRFLKGDVEDASHKESALEKIR